MLFHAHDFTRTIASRERSNSYDAEGATAPETLRQKDRLANTLWRVVVKVPLTEGRKLENSSGEISQVLDRGGKYGRN